MQQEKTYSYTVLLISPLSLRYPRNLEKVDYCSNRLLLNNCLDKTSPFSLFAVKGAKSKYTPFHKEQALWPQRGCFLTFFQIQPLCFLNLKTSNEYNFNSFLVSLWNIVLVYNR